MTEKLAIVSLDRVVWKGNLLRIACKQYAGKFVEYRHPMSTTVHHHKQLALISGAVAGKSIEDLQPGLNEITNKFVTYRDPDLQARLQTLHDGNYRFVALSSAPDFVVRSAVKGYERETGIPFMSVVASQFARERGIYTGLFTRLDKPARIAMWLGNRAAEKVDISFINNAEDASWAENLSREVVAVNPSPWLVKRLAVRTGLVAATASAEPVQLMLSFPPAEQA